MDTQVLVVGAGPGGYVAAIKLGKLGKRVLLVDRDALGGECLNYGCIPSKFLISAAGTLRKALQAKDIGIEFARPRLDLAGLQAWRKGLIAGMGRGVASLSKGNGVDILMGEARFTGPRTAEVRKADGAVEAVAFEHAVIAAGSRPLELPDFVFDGKDVLGNKEALELSELPRRLLVVGGGVVGLEIGTCYAKLGAQVTVVELTAQLLPGIDAKLVAPVARGLARLGVDVFLESKAVSWRRAAGGLEVRVSTPRGEKVVEADKLLLSVGRAAAAAGLGLEAAGVKTTPQGYIEAGEGGRTAVPHIFAVGDIVGPPFLAHKASREAVLAALAIAGKPPRPLGVVPWAVFTDPEVASVGLSETQARERGIETVSGRFPFAACGRARTARETEGFVDVVADKATGRILGTGIVGPGASDVIAEACLAVRLGATLEDVADTIHPHPTLPEAFLEACEAALGQAIHIPAPPKR